MSNYTPWGWAVEPLKRYADFSGRSPRAEYWWFWLFQILAVYLPLMIMVFAGIPSDEAGDPGPLFLVGIALMVVAVLGLLIPNLAVQVRRFHDQDKSGWFMLFAFVPYLGGIILFVFMCIRGDEGSNRFGPDPYAHDHLDRVFA